MNRLTEYHAGVAVIKDKQLLADAMNRLAAYEDLHLSPKDVELIKQMYDEMADEQDQHR